MRKGIFACMLTAMTVALGYSLAAVPNVELMTITVFVSGYLLGFRLGSAVGAVSMAIYSFFNPMGTALFPLLAAQVLVFALIGMVGALSAGLFDRDGVQWLRFLFAGMAGFLLTLFYDLVTSVAAYLIAFNAGTSKGLLPFMAAGILFFTMHQVWNTAVFSLTLVPMLNVLRPFRNGVRNA